jgi:uncharacterized protein YcfJ
MTIEDKEIPKEYEGPTSSIYALSAGVAGAVIGTVVGNVIADAFQVDVNDKAISMVAGMTVGTVAYKAVDYSVEKGQAQFTQMKDKLYTEKLLVESSGSVER